MLVQITEHMWEAQVDLNLIGRLVIFPCRMTVIRLKNGALLLHSPVRIDDALAAEIDTLGPVRTLIAPNCFHHLYLKDVMARYPEAKLYTAPGLAQKRPDLDVTAEIRPGKNLPWADEIEWFPLGGAAKMNEIILLHRATKTLIVTDLMFNMSKVRGPMTPWLLRAAGAWRKPAQSRVWRILTNDRGAAKASLQPVLARPFERVVMAHGDVIERDGKAHFARALQWMLA
ncbi:DUF4336 domain-containing protein [Acanthopleuribacter pedis]|uniref:DUF4336 domain-containing protein n=1 Tax=Acanthopleuribacter pedis TaxID=442870 RepID=A0A8J7Q4K8_9BACT|nr:DUF4336 domain-containing protein [Acanthopleuribacter pedis]MBO1317671.1 DUF4336 domain-containing protein [Acanthopleuribacter pedis]